MAPGIVPRLRLRIDLGLFLGAVMVATMRLKLQAKQAKHRKGGLEPPVAEGFPASKRAC